MKNTTYLTLDSLIAIHDSMIEEYGGSHGIQDLGLIQSALARPQASFGGEDLYPTIFLKADGILFLMIITKNSPFTKEEITMLREEFDTYIKTVIDINKEICSAGQSRHFESEKILLEQHSQQADLWGGGIDLETKMIDFNSFINIRSQDNNTSNEIQDEERRKQFESLMQYFFKEIL